MIKAKMHAETIIKKLRHNRFLSNLARSIVFFRILFFLDNIAIPIPGLQLEITLFDTKVFLEPTSSIPLWSNDSTLL